MKNKTFGVSTARSTFSLGYIKIVDIACFR